MFSDGSLHMVKQKQSEQLEPTYSSSVRIRGVALETYRKRWTIWRSGERGSGISVLMARQYDDDIYIYIYIYIFVCVCVCVCVWLCLSLLIPLNSTIYLSIYLKLSLCLSLSICSTGNQFQRVIILPDIVSNMLDCNFLLSLRSCRGMTFTFRQMPLKVLWTPYLASNRLNSAIPIILRRWYLH